MSTSTYSAEITDLCELQDVAAKGDQLYRINNKGTGHVWLIMVETSGDGTVHGTNDGDGIVRQLGRHYNKTALQKLPKVMLNFGVRIATTESAGSRSCEPAGYGGTQEANTASKFTNQYRQGRILPRTAIKT